MYDIYTIEYYSSVYKWNIQVNGWSQKKIISSEVT